MACDVFYLMVFVQCSPRDARQLGSHDRPANVWYQYHCVLFLDGVRPSRILYRPGDVG